MANLTLRSSAKIVACARAPFFFPFGKHGFDVKHEGSLGLVAKAGSPAGKIPGGVVSGTRSWWVAIFFWLGAIGASLGSLATAGLAAPAEHEGVATCSGSTCHGRLGPNPHGVRQNEISTWQDVTSSAGAHSRAWAVLGDARARGIADRLGIASAQSSPLCLGCHVDPAAQRGSEIPGRRRRRLRGLSRRLEHLALESLCAARDARVERCRRHDGARATESARRSFASIAISAAAIRTSSSRIA